MRRSSNVACVPSRMGPMTSPGQLLSFSPTEPPGQVAGASGMPGAASGGPFPTCASALPASSKTRRHDSPGSEWQYVSLPQASPDGQEPPAPQVMLQSRNDGE